MFNLEVAGASLSHPLVAKIKAKMETLGCKTVWVNHDNGSTGHFGIDVVCVCIPNLDLVWKKWGISPLEVYIHECIHALQSMWGGRVDYANINGPHFASISVGGVDDPQEWLAECKYSTDMRKTWLAEFPYASEIMGYYEKKDSFTREREKEAYAFSRLIILSLEGKITPTKQLLNLMKDLGIN